MKHEHQFTHDGLVKLQFNVALNYLFARVGNETDMRAFAVVFATLMQVSVVRSVDRLQKQHVQIACDL